MKQIQIKSQSIEKKISVIGSIFFGKLSDVESKVLKELILLKEPSIILNSNVSKSLRSSLGLNDNTFSVALSRLVKKGAVKKQKTLITLAPILNKLEEENDFVVRFTE